MIDGDECVMFNESTSVLLITRGSNSCFNESLLIRSSVIKSQATCQLSQRSSKVAKKSAKQSVKESANQPESQQTNQPAIQPTNQPDSQPAN